MNLSTENLVIKRQNEDLVDFSEVKTIEQLKEFIIYNYVVLCRKCASSNFCKFYSTSEPPCPILENVVRNYIDMNIKTVNVENQHSLSEFILSIIYLIEIFNDFENWIGICFDEEFNWYFESSHPFVNSLYAHNLLIKISKFIKAYRIVEINRLKYFVIFVEGNSEYEALPPIFSALGVLGINFDNKNSVKFINLQGKDSIQKEKIKTNLIKFREEDISYFIILDNDSNVEDYIEDLKREGLLKDSQYLIWDNKFEDNFSEEAILKMLKEEVGDIVDKINIEELKEYNSKKGDIINSLEFIMRKNDIDLKYDDYKVNVAVSLSKWVCREIRESMISDSGSVDGGRTPKSICFPTFVEKIRTITEEIEKISSDFHVVK